MSVLEDMFPVDWALPPPRDLVLEWEQDGDRAVVRVAGAVDSHATQKLKDTLGYLLERCVVVTVEFGQLDHVGPEILGVLVWAMQRARKAGNDVVGRIATDDGTRVLRIVGLSEDLTFALE